MIKIALIFGFIGFLLTLFYGISNISVNENNKIEIREIILIIIMSFGSWLGFILLFMGYNMRKMKDEYWSDVD